MWGATDQERQEPSCQNVINGGSGCLLKLGDGIHLAWVGYIEEMMGDQRPFLWRDLGSANVHAAVDLTRIGGDDLTVKTLGQGDAQRALAGRSWPQHHDQDPVMLKEAKHLA